MPQQPPGPGMDWNYANYLCARAGIDLANPTTGDCNAFLGVSAGSIELANSRMKAITDHLQAGAIAAGKILLASGVTAQQISDATGIPLWSVNNQLTGQ